VVRHAGHVIESALVSAIGHVIEEDPFEGDVCGIVSPAGIFVDVGVDCVDRVPHIQGVDVANHLNIREGVQLRYAIDIICVGIILRSRSAIWVDDDEVLYAWMISDDSDQRLPCHCAIGRVDIERYQDYK